MKNFIVIIFCQYQNQDLFCLNFLLSCKFYFAVKLYIFLRNLFYSQIFYLLGAYVIYVVIPEIVPEEDWPSCQGVLVFFWGTNLMPITKFLMRIVFYRSARYFFLCYIAPLSGNLALLLGKSWYHSCTIPCLFFHKKRIHISKIEEISYDFILCIFAAIS